MKLTEHFDSSEFACPCCGQSKMQDHTMRRLEILRQLYGKPMRIVEGGGYRCSNFDQNEHSAHREGRAADPAIPREDLYRLIELAQRVQFTGIGVKNRNGRFQLHLDDAPNIPGIRPRPWVWTYDAG